MIDPTFVLSYESITIPYRYEPSLLTRAKHDHKIKMTRHHDGFMREDAIRNLLSMEPTEEIAAYYIVALSDYVIEIGQLIIDRSSPELIQVMASVADKNREVIKRLEEVIISYWNEHYRDDYESYTEYPPYEFLQSLKNGEV